MDTLDYEALVEDFETKLITKLRSFGPQTEYLEMWVPDSDPVKSILNMVEAAQAYGQGEMSVSISSKIFPLQKANELVALTADMAKLTIQDNNDKILILATDIK